MVQQNLWSWTNSTVAGTSIQERVEFKSWQSSDFLRSTQICYVKLWCRVVVPGGAEDAMAKPDFGRSVNPISTRGTDYAHLITTVNPGFFRASDDPINVKLKVIKISFKTFVAILLNRKSWLYQRIVKWKQTDNLNNYSIFLYSSLRFDSSSTPSLVKN